MNQRQLDHLNMYDAVLLTLGSNSSTWSSNTAISAVVTAAQAQVVAINNAQIGQINNSKAFTINKENLRNNLVALALLHADAGRSYAASIGNTVLQQELKTNKSALLYLTDGQLAPYCQNIYNFVNPLVGSLASYGVTAATLAALQSSINAFLASVGQPHSIRSGAVAYTITIEEQIKTLNTLMKEQLDPLLTQYKTSHAIFHTQYLTDRKLPHTGHRTTVTIVGQIDDASGQPIKHAHITINTLKPRKKVTKPDGLYKFARLKPGTYVITVIAQGYTTQTKTLTISTPHTVRQNFFLVVTTGTGGGPVGPNTNTNNTQ